MVYRAIYQNGMELRPQGATKSDVIKSNLLDNLARAGDNGWSRIGAQCWRSSSRDPNFDSYRKY